MFNTLKVLLAEDEESDVILIRRALDRLGLADRLTSVSNGERVIPYLCGEGEYADRQAYPFPDVLLMDHRMPRLSGLDVLFWLRTEPRFEHLPVVILTAGLLPDETRVAQDLRAACVLKTVEFNLMPRAIKEGISTALQMMRGVPG